MSKLSFARYNHSAGRAVFLSGMSREDVFLNFPLSEAAILRTHVLSHLQRQHQYNFP